MQSAKLLLFALTTLVKLPSYFCWQPTHGNLMIITKHTIFAECYCLASAVARALSRFSCAVSAVARARALLIFSVKWPIDKQFPVTKSEEGFFFHAPRRLAVFDTSDQNMCSRGRRFWQVSSNVLESPCLYLFWGCTLFYASWCTQMTLRGNEEGNVRPPRRSKNSAAPFVLPTTTA